MASLPLGSSTATWRRVTISSRSGGPRHVGRVVDPLVRDDGEVEPDLQLAGEQSTKNATPGQADGNPGFQAPGSPDAEPADSTPVTTESSEIEQPAVSSSGSSNPPETTVEDSGISETSAEAGPGAHPVREKLLRRAQAAKARPTSEPSTLSQAGKPERPRGLAEFDDADRAKHPRDLELERIAAPLLHPPSAPPLGQRRGQLSPNMVALFGALIGLLTVASLIALVMNLDAGVRDEVPPEPIKEVAREEAKPKQRPVGALPKRERKKIPGPWRIADAKGDPTTRIIEGKIGNQAFLVAVAEAGLQQKEAYRLLIAYKGLRDLDSCDRNDRFRALVERGSGRLKAFEYEVSAEEVYQAREDERGYLKATRLDLKVARQQVKGSFMYDGEKIRTSAAVAGFEKGLRQVLGKALEGHSSIEELERGDRLRVIAQEVTVLGEFARYAGIEALEILPKNGKDKPLKIYYFHHPRAGGYYNARGQAPYEGGWRVPVRGAPVTSKFNPKRMHPVLNKVMPHNGTDFGAPAGTPVGASSYGTISFIGVAGPSGNLVKIDHPGGIETGYAHLSRFAEGLSVGDKVKRLQVIGYVGSTGRSTGPHLHFSAKKDGTYFDPESLNLDGMRVISLEYRGEFERVRSEYDKLLNAIPVPPPLVEPKPAAVARGEPIAAEPGDDTAGDEAEAQEEEELGSGSGSEAEEAASLPAPAPAKPAAKGAAAVYLTDKELLEMQAGSDDGEVDE